MELKSGRLMTNAEKREIKSKPPKRESIHYRMKGVNLECVKEMANEYFKGDT